MCTCVGVSMCTLCACVPMYVCMWEAEMEGIVVTELCEFSSERLGIYFRLSFAVFQIINNFLT